MNLEQNIIRSQDHTRQYDPLTLLERELLNQYSEKLEHYRIKMDGFSDIYSEKEIKNDKVEIQNIKKNFENKTERGELLEGIMTEQSGWFGENSAIVNLSEYDDTKNHGDFILELKNEKGGISRIMIDVTTSIDREELEKKFERNFLFIEKGKSIPVKYFQSRSEKFKGKIPNIIRVVAGIDPTTLKELCDQIKTQDGGLSKSHISLLFLIEIERQLAYLFNASKKSHGETDCRSQELEKAFSAISKVMKNKKGLRTRDFEQKALNDKVFANLLRFVS